MCAVRNSEVLAKSVGDRVRDAVSYHAAGMSIYGSHFFPYSIIAYPLIAVARSRVRNMGRGTRAAVRVLYIAAAVLYCTQSYFFNYTFAWAANPQYVITTGAVALWAFAWARAGRAWVALAPFFLVTAYNIAGGGSYPPVHFSGAGLWFRIFCLPAAVLLLLALRRLRRFWIAVVALAGILFSTGNSPLPLIAMMGAGLSIAVSVSRGTCRSFDPPVLALGVFNLLLIFGFAQFYSISLPRALDSCNAPAYIGKVYIYGSEKNGLPVLAARDNRFLSLDPSGRYLLFGTRMSSPDLSRIDAGDYGKVRSLRISNTTDNAVFDPGGEWLVTGSFGRDTLEKIGIDPFAYIRTVKLPFRPIRLRYDAVAGEIFVIGEFRGGQAGVYDAETLAFKRKLYRSREDTNSRDIVLDSARERLIVSQWRDLVLYDSRTFRQLSRLRTDNRGLGRLAIDEREGKVYLSHTRRGAVLEIGYGGDELKLIREIELGTGVRDIDVDPVNGTLAVANYFSGELIILRPGDAASVSRTRLGQRLRHVEFTADGRFVLTTSMAGGYIIDAGKVKGREGRRQLPFLKMYYTPQF